MKQGRHFVCSTTLLVSALLANSAAFATATPQQMTLEQAVLEKQLKPATVLRDERDVALKQTKAQLPGMSFSRYQSFLNNQVQYLSQQLNDRELSQREFNTLNIAHTAAQTKLLNPKASYQAYLQDVQQRLLNLQALEGELDSQALRQAKLAISRGDTRQAEKIFRQLNFAKPSAASAAALNFQLGKLALDNIRYHDALSHFQRAAKKQPENLLYIGEAAFLAGTLGLHRKELQLEKTALKLAIEQYGKYSREVATRHNNLGSAYQSLGNYKKAIKHYHFALASGLRTHGEQHPKVALRRNNLGVAYQNLGLHDKAIEYFAQALVVFEAKLGKSHPNTLAVADSLARAQQYAKQDAKRLARSAE